MPKYRLFPLNEQGHVCDPPTIIEAETDDSALARAMQLVHGRDIEVWDEGRYVGVAKRRGNGHRTT
jgi:hypothetical protein